MKTYPIARASQPPVCTPSQYAELYQQSITDSDAFWDQQARNYLDWDETWHSVHDIDFNKGEIAWFLGAKLNVAYNCIDRHLPERAEQTAIIWQQDEVGKSQKITYQQLHDETAKLANGLKQLGVVAGDRVCIYMPMIPQAVYAMLACARIGAVHSVVFGGFSPQSLKMRILDCSCKIVITADEGIRGGKTVPLKDNVDSAIVDCPCVEAVLVVKHTAANINWGKRDLWYHQLIADLPANCPCQPTDAQAPLFILYTSGSTGKPKGVVHAGGGYLLYVTMTFHYTFDHQASDIFWCTADIGWITGHSYSVYAPLARGATTLLFEGIPTYPDPSRFWQIIDQHQVSIFYTAPTAIRSLMAAGDDFVANTSRDSLRILGTVGEPINPEAWEWYYNKVGNGKCPIVDTWWQTETGGHLITPLPYASKLKPGSASTLFFGINAEIVGEQGEVKNGEAEGILLLTNSWPGQARTLYGDHQRFVQTYFTAYPGKYFTGDGAKRDKDGDYWITGRVDDVLNVSGQRLGTAQIESGLVLHQHIAEAAVVGIAHPIKGQGIYAFVTPIHGIEGSAALQAELVQTVRSEIGAIATVDKIQFAASLPKTRSGKIMRRILRKIAENNSDNLGDTSTLAEPKVIADLIKGRVK